MGLHPDYILNSQKITALQRLAIKNSDFNNSQETTDKIIATAKILLNAGADMDKKGGPFHSAFDMAQQSTDQRLLQLFEQTRAGQQAQSDSDR